MTPIDRSPARFSSLVAAGAGLVAMAPTVYSSLALALGGIGYVLLVAGVARGSRSTVTIGAGGLVLGGLGAGVLGAPAVLVILAVAAAVVAWDVGGNGIDLGRQLGREADTVRVEAVHAGASALVGVTVAGASYGLFRVTTGGKPLTALIFLLLAAVLLASALR